MDGYRTIVGGTRVELAEGVRRRRSKMPRLIFCVVGLVVVGASCGSSSADNDVSAGGQASLELSQASGAAGTMSDGVNEGEGDSDSAADEHSESEVAKGGAPDVGGTRVVESIWGPVEIPTDPQYILAVDEYAALNLLGLGVEPDLVIGTYQADPPRRIIEGYGIEQIAGAYGEYNLEEIASRKPDLIVLVGNEESEDVYQSLSPIAPTVVIPFIAPWRDIVTISGELANQQDRASALIAAIESEIDGLGAVAATGSSISILANSPGFGPYSIGQDTSVSDALEQAGYTRPAAEMSPPAFGVSVPTSEERLGDHAADRMLVMGGGGPFFPADLVLDSEVFNAIPAVGAGNAFVVLGDIWSGTGPFSVYWAIQDLRALEVGEGQAGVATVDSLAERWAAFGALGR